MLGYDYRGPLNLLGLQSRERVDRASRELRLRLAEAARWWERVIGKPVWPVAVLIAEFLMHIHDCLRKGHDKDLHVSLLAPDAYAGRSLHTLRVGSHAETSLQVLELSLIHI